MRQHETPLQLLDLVRRDAHRRELAEPGVDAVDGRAAPRRPFDHRRRRLDRRPAGVVENHLVRSCSERTELLEAERAGGEPDGVSHGGRLSGSRGADQCRSDAALLREGGEHVIGGGKSGFFVLGQGQIHNPEHGTSVALPGGTLPPGPARNAFHFWRAL